MRRSTVLLVSTIGFGVLYLAASFALGTTPKTTDSGATVAAWFQRNSGHVRLWLWFLTLALPLFATFAALVRSALPPTFRDVFFFGAMTFAAETAVQGWLWAGLAWHASQLDPSTARTLLDVASYWGPVLNAATITTLVPVAVLGVRGLSGLPRWLGAVAMVALVEQLVETVTIFGQRGFIAPGGPMNLYLGAGLVAAAWLSLGICVARSAGLAGSALADDGRDRAGH